MSDKVFVVRAWKHSVEFVINRMMRAITAGLLLALVLVLVSYTDAALWLVTTTVVMLAGWEWAKLAPNKGHKNEHQKGHQKGHIERFVRITEAHLLIAALFVVMFAYNFFGVATLILIPLFMPISLLLLPKSEQHELIGIACLAAFGVGFLALYDQFNTEALVWLFVIVIAFDTAAFIGGKIIRGPFLWVAVSPDKRWSGLGAGLLVASVCGTVFLQLDNPESSSLFVSFATSLLVALAAQVGDLAESRLKRRVKIKDSGRILPGHGGILDRIDGYLCAVPMAFLLLSIQN